MTDEHDTVENVASGVSITAKLKRGTGTRDQDEIKIKAKGKTAEEAADNMDQTIAEAREWAGELRQIQPEQEDLRIVFAGEGPHKEFVEVENEQEFDATALHNKVYEAIGEDDELAQYCDALAAAENARDLHEGTDACSERWGEMDDACQQFETVSRERAREVAAEACHEIIKDGDEWTDVWDAGKIEDAQQEAREWLQMNTSVAERVGVMEALAA